MHGNTQCSYIYVLKKNIQGNDPETLYYSEISNFQITKILKLFYPLYMGILTKHATYVWIKCWQIKLQWLMKMLLYLIIESRENMKKKWSKVIW